MECAKAKGLLSEYIEGLLDGPTRVLVEEHLKSCAACLREKADLESYFAGMSSLKKVAAPQDFLEKVHTRLERRFEFEKLMRGLFVPLHIKVPLEAVAVAVCVIFIINIYRTPDTRPVMQVAQVAVPEAKIASLPAPSAERIKIAKVVPERIPAPEITENKIDAVNVAGETPVQPEVKPAKAANIPQPAAVPASIGDAPKPVEKKKMGPIRLALVIKPSQPPAAASGMMKAMNQLEALEGTREDPAGTASVTGFVKKPAPKQAIRDREEMTKALDKTLISVRGLAGRYGGNIIFVDYNKETHLPQSVKVAVPSRNYKPFLGDLAKLGSLEAPPPENAAVTSEPVLVEIKFIASK